MHYTVAGVEAHMINGDRKVSMAYARDWTSYFSKRLKEAEERLAGFDQAVATYGRVFDIAGNRDVTDEERKELEDAVEEYRRCLNELE